MVIERLVEAGERGGGVRQGAAVAAVNLSLPPLPPYSPEYETPHRKCARIPHAKLARPIWPLDHETAPGLIL